MPKNYKKKRSKKRVNWKRLARNLLLFALVTLILVFAVTLFPLYWPILLNGLKSATSYMLRIALNLPSLLRSYVPSMLSWYFGEWPSIFLFVLTILFLTVYLYRGKPHILFLWLFLLFLSGQAWSGYLYPNYPLYKEPTRWIGRLGVYLFETLAIPLGELPAIVIYSFLTLIFFIFTLFGLKKIIFSLRKPNSSTSLTKPPKPRPKLKPSSLELTTEYILPSSDMLKEHPTKTELINKDRLAAIVDETINSFGINGMVDEVTTGPTFLRVTVKVERGTRLNQLTSISNELSMALGVSKVRIDAPIPGKPNTVAIEVPREKRSIVSIKNIIKSQEFNSSNTPLPLVLGLADNPIVEDIRNLPHLLIGGSSGTGKTICLHSILCGILFTSTPREVRIVLIDPKRVEFIDYEGIPHLLYPVITEVNTAVRVLKLLTHEMDNRYKLFEEKRVSDLQSYNKIVNEQEKLPYILIVVDELADMISLNKESEKFIVRLAQKARAAGINLIVATQRPTINVVTGLIKTNFSSRIAFAVPTQIDSRIILDRGGAEKLLGKGDMLYLSQEASKPKRIQGAFLDKEELRAIISHWKKQLKEAPLAPPEEPLSQEELEYDEEIDPLTREVVKIILQHGMASTSLLQRRLSIGYARAARILDYLEHRGIVGPGESSKPRKLLITKWENLPPDLFES